MQTFDHPKYLQARMPLEVEKKNDHLRENLKSLVKDGLCVAFSGGVDSAFLLWSAEMVRREFSGRLIALTAVSASMAQVERQDARIFAHELEVEHLWIESGEVSNPAYIANDGRRCYFCKSELFRIGRDVLANTGCRWLAYGYNASDRGDHRPGHKAAIENEVLAPLAEAELSKDDIRTIMRWADLKLAGKPASPCLSSRLMTGVMVTETKLRDVEELETVLRNGGLEIFRVRLHEEGKTSFVRVEVAPESMPLALTLREEFVAAAKARGYRWVVLDLAGYRMGGGV